jgi:hypothetical protein
MLESMLPVLLPVLKKQLPKIEPTIIQLLSQYPVEAGEAGVTAMLSVEGNVVFIIIVGVDAECRIVRVVKRSRLTEFIENVVKTKL